MVEEGYGLVHSSTLPADGEETEEPTPAAEVALAALQAVVPAADRQAHKWISLYRFHRTREANMLRVAGLDDRVVGARMIPFACVEGYQMDREEVVQSVVSRLDENPDLSATGLRVFATYDPENDRGVEFSLDPETATAAAAKAAEDRVFEAGDYLTLTMQVNGRPQGRVSRRTRSRSPSWSWTWSSRPERHAPHYQ